MRKTVIKTLALVSFLLIAIIEVPLPGSAQAGQEVTLYLYGEDPNGEDTYFSTDAPTSPGGNSNNLAASGGVFILYRLGTWETGSLDKDLHVEGVMSASIWIENEENLPASATVSCRILRNSEETGQEIESDEVSLDNSPQEISFSGFVDENYDESDTFGINMWISYRGTGAIYYWAHVDYDSHIIVNADWVSLDIQEPTIDDINEEAVIDASVIHALGVGEIVAYDIQIDGPTPATTISEPVFTPQGNGMVASWTWDFGIDNAQAEAIYTATVTVTDNSGNDWVDTRDFYVSGAPPPPPVYNWTVIGQLTSWFSDEGGHNLMIDDNGIFWLAFSSDNSNNYDIWLMSSSNGIDWNEPIQVTTNTSADLYCSMIQDSQGTYWMSWYSDRSGTVQIWMSSSIDGVNWNEPYQAVSSPHENVYPSLIQDSDGIYWLAWTNINYDTFEIHIQISSSTDGISWSAPVSVTTGWSWNWAPSLIQDNNGVYWIAYDSDETGPYEIWMSSSNDGVNWNSPIQITTDGHGSYFPSLIQNASGGYDLTFDSDRTGDFEIWRLSSVDGNIWLCEDRVTNRSNSDEFDSSLVQDDDETYWSAWVSDLGGDLDIWISQKLGNLPPKAIIYDLSGNQSGNITFQYILRDADSDLCSIQPEYSTDGTNFFPPTQGSGGDGTIDLTSSPSGILHTYVWASNTDLDYIDSETVYFRITPYDLKKEGEQDTTGPFHLINNRPPEVEIYPISNEQSGNITINYTLIDMDSDALNISCEFSRDDYNYFVATRCDIGDPTSNLTSSSEGVQHSFVWDSETDLGEIDNKTVYFRITPHDPAIQGESNTTGPFHVDNNEIPEVVISLISDEQSDDITINYTLIDIESDILSIECEFSLDGNNYLQATKGNGGDPIYGLISSPAGIKHSFVWGSKTDLDEIDDETVYFRITPYDGDAGISDDTNAFHVDNNDPPEIEIETPSGENSGDVIINYILYDIESDDLSVIPEYSTDGVNFLLATKSDGGDPTSDLTSSPGGIEHEFIWDSMTDLKGIDDTIYFRMTPKDQDNGVSYVSNPFHVDNNEEPAVEVNTPTKIQAGEIIINFTLTDEESDEISISAEYSEEGIVFHSATAGSGGDGQNGLISSPQGSIHIFVWHSALDLGEVELSSVYFRITPYDNDKGDPDTTTSFSIDNKAPTITSGPFVSSITESTAIIEWETDEPSTSLVRYGKSAISESQQSSSEFVTVHTITITGLQPDTSYFYCVYSEDRCCNGPCESDEEFFITEKKVNNPPVIMIISPMDGAKVKGKINVSGTAFDLDGDETIEYVEFRIDDSDWSEAEDTAIWFFSFDTKLLGDGKHMIYVRAFDGEDYSELANVTIKVDNQEDFELWLFVGIGALIVVIGAVVAAYMLLRKRRSRPGGPKLVQYHEPEIFTQVSTPEVPPIESPETEPVVVSQVKIFEHM